MTIKWIEVNDSSNGQYYVDNNIKFKTPMLRPDLCNYGDVYIFVKRTITVAGTNSNNRRNKNF